MADNSHLPSGWTDDDRDIRNFLGLMASVAWGAVVMTLLTVPNYNRSLVAVVGGVALVLTVGFFAWKRIRIHIGHVAYQHLARLASDTRIPFAVVFTLIIWLIATGLLDRYRDINLNLLSQGPQRPITNVRARPGMPMPTARAEANPTPVVEGLTFQQTLELARAFKASKATFVGEFSNVPRPAHGWYQGQLDCKVYVTSTESNDAFRSEVEDIARAMDCEPQPHPTLDTTDADATPIPTPTARSFVVIRVGPTPTGPPPTQNPLDPANVQWSRKIAAARAADILIPSFRNIGLVAKRSEKIASDEDPTEIYIELGTSAPWHKSAD